MGGILPLLDAMFSREPNRPILNAGRAWDDHIKAAFTPKACEAARRFRRERGISHTRLCPNDVGYNLRSIDQSQEAIACCELP